MDKKVAIFKALGNTTRFMMFKMIFTKSIICSIDKNLEVTEQDAQAICVTTIATQFPYSMAAISKHLKELRLAGLVLMEKRGSKIFIEANAEVVKELSVCFGELGENLEKMRADAVQIGIIA